MFPGRPPGPRGSRPNPANYRPHGRGARSPTAFPRPRRKPLSAAPEQRAIQPTARAPPPPPRCGVFLSSCPLALSACRQGLAPGLCLSGPFSGSPSVFSLSPLLRSSACPLGGLLAVSLLPVSPPFQGSTCRLTLGPFRVTGCLKAFPSLFPGDPAVLALLRVRGPRMLWAQAMTLAWFGGGEFWALSGARQLQDSEKLGTCPELGQGRCGGAATAACEEGVLSGPRVPSSWCPVARPQRQSNSEAVPALGTATSPSGVGHGEGLGCPGHAPGPASLDKGSSRIYWEYMSRAFWAGHRMSLFGHFKAQEIHSFVHSTNIY